MNDCIRKIIGDQTSNLVPVGDIATIITVALRITSDSVEGLDMPMIVRGHIRPDDLMDLVEETPRHLGTDIPVDTGDEDAHNALLLCFYERPVRRPVNERSVQDWRHPGRPRRSRRRSWSL
jgi:hypothetical protein